MFMLGAGALPPCGQAGSPQPLSPRICPQPYGAATSLLPGAHRCAERVSAQPPRQPPFPSVIPNLAN